MPFTVAPMLEEDIDAFSVIDEHAMAHVALAKAMEGGSTTPRRVFAAEWTRKEWGQDPSKVWMKATDDETGEMAAAALWAFHADGYRDGKGKRTAASSAPAEGEGKEDKVGEALEKQGEGKKEEASKAGETPSIFEVLTKSHTDFMDEFVQDRPVAWLSILVTEPRFQRRGAASLLVKWGCDQADERGWWAGLCSTNDGLNVYKKFGFEIKKSREMDLRPWGVDDVELRRHMVRLPKPKQT